MMNWRQRSYEKILTIDVQINNFTKKPSRFLQRFTVSKLYFSEPLYNEALVKAIMVALKEKDSGKFD
jgi:hypothetical protein